MPRRLLILLIVACGLISAITCAVSADGPRKYKKDYSDQDLSGRSFAGQDLDDCNFENADCSEASFERAILRNCNFQGTTLKRTNFYKADLTGADFRGSKPAFMGFNFAILDKANFSGVDLTSASMHDSSLKGANLRNVKGIREIYNANFYGADLRGANLDRALDINASAKFRKAKYDRRTRWHKGFDVESSGATLVEEEDKPESKPAQPDQPNDDAESAKALEKEFNKLDVNEDHVLSGKEMKGLESYDANKDGEITLAEFLAGRAKARKSKSE